MYDYYIEIWQDSEIDGKQFSAIFCFRVHEEPEINFSESIPVGIKDFNTGYSNIKVENETDLKAHFFTVDEVYEFACNIKIDGDELQYKDKPYTDMEF